jgi:hypothetical protein
MLGRAALLPRELTDRQIDGQTRNALGPDELRLSSRAAALTLALVHGVVSLLQNSLGRAKRLTRRKSGLLCRKRKHSKWTFFVQTFSWRAAPVIVDYTAAGDAFLKLWPNGVERDSPAPATNALWLRLTACARTDSSYEAFATDYGLLWGRPGERIADWRAFSGHLSHIAEPWGAPWAGDPGDLEIRPGAAAALIQAGAHLAELTQQALLQGDITPAATTDGPDFAANNLAGYLVLQATAARKHPPIFRRCGYSVCAGWFALTRRDQRFCSARHRALAHAQKE